MALRDQRLRDRVCAAYVDGVMHLPLESVPQSCVLEWDALRRRMAAPAAPSLEVAARWATERAPAEELQWLARCTAFVLLHRFVFGTPDADEEVPSFPAIEGDEVWGRCLALGCDRTTHLRVYRGKTLGAPRENGWILARFVDSSICPDHANGKLAITRKRAAIASWSALAQMVAADEPLPERIHRAFVSGIMPREETDVPPFAYRYWGRLRALHDASHDPSLVRASIDEASPGKLGWFGASTLGVLLGILCRVDLDVAMVEGLRPGSPPRPERGFSAP
jgi:hypothetical protein